MRLMTLTARLLATLMVTCGPTYVSAAGEAPAPSAAPPVNAELGADGVQRATLTLDSYSFSPAHVVVEAGKPVELTLNNVASLAPHNLTVDDPKAGFSVSQDVSAGKSAVAQFTPTVPGTYAFYCNKKLLMLNHRKKGMEGVLEVR